MVMFTCNRCSAGLKKNQVETHAFRCGGVLKIDLTCHDCLKDFRGKAYESHTSCITEEARYGGKGVVVKEAGKKQNKWCEVVQNVLAKKETLDPAVHRFLKSAVQFSNIPRKKKAFLNWANNVMKWADTQLIDKVFAVLEAEFLRTNSSEQSKSQNGSTKEEGESEIPEKGGSSKKVDSSCNGINEIDENDANSESPRKKKKDKKRKSHETTEGVDEEPPKDISLNGASEIIENDEVPKKKKKKSKKSTEVTEETSLGVVDELIADDVSGNKIQENGNIRKNKKKKKSAENMNEEPMEGLEESSVVTNDKPAEIAQPAMENVDEAKTQKLSKKERKQLKKKNKFEAEVKEIENFKKVEEEIVEDEKPKKSKKRKGLAEETEEGQKDGAKKRKVEAEQLETKCEQQEKAVSPQKVKFNWHETILAVLKKSKNDEVPVKKMTKHVIDEYITQYGDKGIHEKLYSKMNKKLQTCPGVRVLKEKVKLLENDR